MNLSLPSASQLLLRFGARDIAQVAAPDSGRTIEPDLLTAAATGEPLDEWEVEDVAIAIATLARIADAISRARNEVSFYLRFRPATAAAEPWVSDDLAEIARYHLYDDAGKEGSTVRVIYKDVIRRLETLAAEDEKRGASKAGNYGVQLHSQPRLMSRKSLGSL